MAWTLGGRDYCTLAGLWRVPPGLSIQDKMHYNTELLFEWVAPRSRTQSGVFDGAGAGPHCEETPRTMTEVQHAPAGTVNVESSGSSREKRMQRGHDAPRF